MVVCDIGEFFGGFKVSFVFYCVAVWFVVNCLICLYLLCCLVSCLLTQLVLILEFFFLCLVGYGVDFGWVGLL